jgi:hypothetical protein
MTADDDPCPHDYQHRAGIVTSHPGGIPPKGEAHASVVVCGDPTCRARGMAWVWKQTGTHGTYISDSTRRAPTPPPPPPAPPPEEPPPPAAGEPTCCDTSCAECRRPVNGWHPPAKLPAYLWDTYIKHAQTAPPRSR